MSHTKISNTVTTTVVLGTGGYGNTLTITGTGDISPTAYGADGIDAPAGLSGVLIVNRGEIQGGKGAPGEAGGIALDMQAAGTITNLGNIRGGAGGYAQPNSAKGGDGGLGVFLDANATLINRGDIDGGNAGLGGSVPGGAGGIGVALYGGSVINTGIVLGGSGNEGDEVGGVGGAAITVHGGTVTNHGTLIGGNGNYSLGQAGSGGDAADIFSSSILVNTGVMTGGNGSQGAGNSGTGGAGCMLASGGTIINRGVIAGGTAGYSYYGSKTQGTGGVGIRLAAGGTINNSGTVMGGAGIHGGREGYPSNGGDGANLLAGGVISNTGTFAGGTGGFGRPDGGAGGRGLFLVGGRLENNNTIVGGVGGAAGGGQMYQPGVAGDGGEGVEAGDGATIANHGSIAGGAGGQSVEQNGEGDGNGGIGLDLISAAKAGSSGDILGGAGGNAVYAYGPDGKVTSVGGSGGAGADLAAGTSLTNTGIIEGGRGGYIQDSPSTAGAGGAGALVDNSAKLISSGSITGGTGGAAYAITGPIAGQGAAGGAGVDLEGGTVTNTGIIQGGAGGYGIVKGGTGGAGVYINGGVFTDGGTVSGGAGGVGGNVAGSAGAAVQFGSNAGTMVLLPGAIFNGIVAANGVNDTLVLAGTSSSTLSALGGAFTGFTTISESTGANWILANTNLLDAGSSLQVSGLLTVAGALDDAGAITIQAGGELTTGTAGVIETAGSLTMTGGTLLASAGGRIAIATAPIAQAGTIVVGPYSPQTTEGISGFGTISGGAIVDNSVISATGGTLDLENAVSGGGTLEIGSGATLLAGASLAQMPMIFSAAGTATLALAAPTQDISVNDGFGAGDKIDLLGLQATSLHYAMNTLTVLNDGKAVCALLFSGNYQLSDFALGQDGHGGTDISFVSAIGSDAGISPAGHQGSRPGAGIAFWEHVPEAAHASVAWLLSHW